MAYDSKQVLKVVEKAIKDRPEIWFFSSLEDITGISSDTLVKHLKILGKLEYIKKLILENKAKASFKAKFNLMNMVDNPTAQIAMLKITGVKEERDILNGVERDEDGEKVDNDIKVTIVRGNTK